MSDNIKGKVVAITGASSELSEATARLLTAQGAIVVLGARRSACIQALADKLTGSGGGVIQVLQRDYQWNHHCLAYVGERKELCKI